ncbi:MAG: NADH-quinone oxidoreductase subunit L [Dehalococcoidia bacterium]|nr:NADH-quinone oxidoreductase subunit L [Dehalococcoidia bacterium]
MNVGVAASIAFWIMAIIAVVSALAVIVTRDIFRAALFLILAFLTVAGLFITLSADFVAAVQVLVYGGAISILLIFAVLLTRDVQKGNPSNRMLKPAVFLGALFAATLIVVITNSTWKLSGDSPPQGTTAAIGDALVNSYVLPFEIASVLLLAAMIGAIVVARGRDE